MMQVEEVTNVAAFAAQLEGRGTGSFRAMTQQASFRLPLDQLAALDAMAEQAGKSRTYVVSQLIEIGIEALRCELDKKVAGSIRKAQSAKLSALLAAHDGEEGEE